MARTQRLMRGVDPETIRTVLADAWTYGDWVVGSSETRDVEGEWPEPGATFHHTQGFYGIGIKDTTTVLEDAPPRRLVLEVRARPVTVARVEFLLEPRAEGTEVTMIEEPIGGLAAKLPSLLVDPPLDLRNRETLRRLEQHARGNRSA